MAASHCIVSGVLLRTEQNRFEASTRAAARGGPLSSRTVPRGHVRVTPFKPSIWRRLPVDVPASRLVAHAVATANSVAPLDKAQELVQWLEEAGFPSQPIKVADAGAGYGLGCVASRPVKSGEVILSVPENFTVTAVDVASHPALSTAAEGRGDLVLLALWLLWEINQGEASPWHPYVRTFPRQLASPLLWSQEERDSLLRGFSGVEDFNQRVVEVEAVFQDLNQNLFAKDRQQFPEDAFTLDAFKWAFAAVLSRAVYLEAADIFALIPFADFLNHSPQSQTVLEYDPDSGSVVLRADRAYKEGEQVFVSYGLDRSSAELALRYGFVPDTNPNDYILFSTSLLRADPLFAIKKQLLAEEGLTESETFPLYSDRFPRQLLSYLRLARVQDSAQLARVTFKSDVIVSESNEYEVLMLVLSDCKERLMTFPQTLEDDRRIINFSSFSQQRGGPLSLLQRKDASSEEEKVQREKERLAAQLRAMEKQILDNTVTALRQRLAPIRGIPTKSGMGDPNAEIKEMFDLMEASFSVPTKVISDFFGKKK